MSEPETSQPSSSHEETEASSFLKAHPEIRTGRDAMEQAEKDDVDRFSIVNRPLSNVILVQYFNADTLERVFAVALVDDEKAQRYYEEENADGNDDEDGDSKGCSECGAGFRATVHGPDRFLFERMATCPDTCSKGQVGRMWPA